MQFNIAFYIWQYHSVELFLIIKERHPEINLILNTRNLAKTIKSWTKIDTFFATSGLLSTVYNLQSESDTTECPADFEDVKWWDLRRKVKPTTPESVTAKWVVFIW